MRSGSGGASGCVLQVDPDSVNVKVKSGEGLDAVGHEEAVAAQAICLIERD